MAEAAVGRWPISIAIPVAWGDMDAFGHVNNTVFLRRFEDARIVYFERIGLLERMRRDGVGPILARATCDYRRALEYPDHVLVEATVTGLGRSSFVMGYRVHSRRLGALAAEGAGVMVLFDYGTEHKVPLDEELRQAIHALEAEGDVGRETGNGS